MRVSQEFINLLNLPKEQLQAIADELDVDLPRAARKWDIASLLARQGTRKLAPHAGNWIFAGKTSVTFFRLGDGSPLDRNLVVKALTDMADGLNPLTEDIRPEKLTSRPSLVEATEAEGKIFLSFGLKKPVAKVLQDFEMEEIQVDEFFVAVIRPEAAVMEVRTNNQRARRFANTWLSEFCEFFDAAAGERVA